MVEAHATLSSSLLSRWSNETVQGSNPCRPTFLIFCDKHYSMATEVGVRSLLKKEKYDELIEFFRREGEFVGEDDMETCYFDAKFDVRMQRNNSFSKVWVKGGRADGGQREETEIRFDRKDFDNLVLLFQGMGHDIQVKWLRKRHTFRWQGMDVILDYARGYGYTIELGKACEEDEREMMMFTLKQKMMSLGVQITPKEEFDRMYQYYRDNWKMIVS